MERNLPVAAFFGLVVGLSVYVLFVRDWFIAVGIASVYTGAGYFYLAFDLSLLNPDLQFRDRQNKLGYAIGLFGLSVSPLAFAEYYGRRDSATIVFVTWFMAVIAFLLLASEAYHQE